MQCSFLGVQLPLTSKHYNGHSGDGRTIMQWGGLEKAIVSRVIGIANWMTAHGRLLLKGIIIRLSPPFYEPLIR